MLAHKLTPPAEIAKKIKEKSLLGAKRRLELKLV